MTNIRIKIDGCLTDQLYTLEDALELARWYLALGYDVQLVEVIN